MYQSYVLGSPLELPVESVNNDEWKQDGDAPIALHEQVILAVHMDHPVLEHALPFVLHTLDL